MNEIDVVVKVPGTFTHTILILYTDNIFSVVFSLRDMSGYSVSFYCTSILFGKIFFNFLHLSRWCKVYLIRYTFSKIILIFLITAFDVNLNVYLSTHFLITFYDTKVNIWFFIYTNRQDVNNFDLTCTVYDYDTNTVLVCLNQKVSRWLNLHLILPVYPSVYTWNGYLFYDFIHFNVASLILDNSLNVLNQVQYSNGTL